MKAKIYKPAKTAMQSGRGKSDHWVFEYIPTSERIPESLMGWISSDDTLNQVKIKFDSLEKAKDFANNKGIEYTVDLSHHRRIKPRNYSDNFKYTPPKETDIRKTVRKTKTPKEQNS